jgi:type VI secretion system secreted protein VgrG
VLLIAEDLEIDLERVLRNPVRFLIHREGGDVAYHGILLHFEQLHEVGGFGFYRAYLVPRLWWLTLMHHNQVFLGRSIPEVVEEVLKDGGLTSADYEFRLKDSYRPLEYVCQYGESHLDFISRWCEREGIYYYFDQSGDVEKVIFTDASIAHTEMPQGSDLYYSPPSGLEALHLGEVVSFFNCRWSLTPSSVFLKDYNYMKPSLEVSGSADVSPGGRGQFYYYGDHFQTPEEGRRMARIRAESILCRREEYRGEGSVPYMVPGFTFDLRNHYRKGFNRRYLATEVRHEGSQAGYLTAGLQSQLAEAERRVYYRNDFTVIPASVQFRPERKTERPRIAGAITARIDAAGSGQYAELDEHGRYKVVLPFDLSGRKDGKASAWVRMAQPYAGSDHGMHFPLHKGTEVLLTFIDGDPDRPIIASAVPNPETPSPVKDSNQTMAAITTGGGNKIHIEDQAGSERILLHSPQQKSFVRIGAPNDPDSPGWDFEHGKRTEENFGIHLATDGLLDIIAETENKVILGEATETIAIGCMDNVVGFLWETVIGIDGELNMAVHKEFTPLHHEFHPERIRVGSQDIEIRGKKIRFVGTATEVTGNHTLVTGNATEVTGEHTAVSGNATTVSGNNTMVEGDATHVTGNYTSVAGNATTVWGNYTTVDGNATKVSGDRTTVSGNQTTTVTGGHVAVTGANTTVSSNVQEITSANVEIAGTVILT